MVEDRERDTRRSVRRVSPSEAKSLLDLGYFYVDVRSVEEFHDLHPEGALNVPIAPPKRARTEAVEEKRETAGVGARHEVANSAAGAASTGSTGSAIDPASAAFLDAMARLFSRDAKIVVGCATGVRSLRAAELLLRAGFTDVVDQRAGIDGARGPFGNVVEPGWSAEGLPLSSGPDAGSFAALQGKADAERARS